jgi:hypothetical protein
MTQLPPLWNVLTNNFFVSGLNVLLLCWFFYWRISATRLFTPKLFRRLVPIVRFEHNTIYILYNTWFVWKNHINLQYNTATRSPGAKSWMDGFDEYYTILQHSNQNGIFLEPRQADDAGCNRYAWHLTLPILRVILRTSASKPVTHLLR